MLLRAVLKYSGYQKYDIQVVIYSSIYVKVLDILLRRRSTKHAHGRFTEALKEAIYDLRKQYIQLPGDILHRV